MTKTTQHSFLFRLWIKLRGILAIIIVFFGIIIALISMILPNEDLYKAYVVEFLSNQWQKQVEIKSITGKWKGFGPKFIIEGLTIKDKDEVVVQQATLKINVFHYFIPKGSTGISLGISDIAVDLERKPSGRIVMTNEEVKKESFSDKLENLLDTGSLSVNNLSLNLYDSVNDQQKTINSKITVQQNADVRAFVLELDSQGLAKNITFKAVTSKQNDFMQEAKWYILVNDLSLQKLAELTSKRHIPIAFADAQIWADTKGGNIVKMLAQGELKNHLFSSDAEVTGKVELVFKGDKQNWDAELGIKNIKTNSIAQEQINVHLSRRENTIKLNADVLDVSLLKVLTQVLDIANDDFYSLDLSGKISNVAIEYNVDSRRIINADLEFQQLAYSAEYTQLNHLSGAISFHDEQIRLLVDSTDGSAEIPNILRGKVSWNNLSLTAQTSMQDDDLDIKINSLWCDCKDFTLDGSARIGYSQQLLLDLRFAVYNAQINQLYKYWPANIWKPKALNFLDQALVVGVVKKGMIIYHGFKSEYPFKDNQGVLSSRSYLNNAKIKFHKDWPLLTSFTAKVDTVNTKLTVKAKTGKVLNAKIKDVIATVENFKKPYLIIDVLAQGMDNYLIDILKKSSMNRGLKVLKEDIVLVGLQKIKVHLGFPLNRPNVQVVPKGEVHFFDTNFQLGQFQLEKLNGIIDFDGFSLTLKDLQSQFLHQNVRVMGEILNQPNQATKIDVLLSGSYDVANFESVLGFSLPAKGRSPWLFSISNKHSEATDFTAQSDLNGIQLDMPKPFAKNAEQLTPFSISCTLPCINSGWDLQFDEKFHSNFKLDSKSNEFRLNKLIFGKADVDFGGQIDVLDVDKWISLLVSNKTTHGSNNIPFQQMTLQVSKLIFSARELNNVEIEIVKNNEGITVNLDGDEIKGSVEIANNLARKGIIVQLDKLHWKAPDIEKVQQSDGQIGSRYPALHIWIGDFIYDGIPLGESSIEVRPTADGIRVEKLATNSELLKLNINGSWDRNQGQNGLSQFNIILTSKNIAKFLANLGFQAPISQAETIIDMQAQWDDFPSQFEIKNISGKMRIEVGKGEVIDAKPGMGRVLGLFSLTNLPRRLILDFSDVLGKGLHFSSMRGDFDLINGDAYTESFVIDSSSAKIILSGKTGLANQDYDQVIIVEPRVGRVLPTIGAIAGGAVGAAAGFLVQGMFHKGLKDVGKIIYKVTGSWDNPEIKLIETLEKKR